MFCMNNDITKLLNLKDSDVKVLQIKETKSVRTVVLEKELSAHFCSVCGCRMYSKGIRKRYVNHPIMQDGMQLVLEIHQRRWQCSDPNCRDIETDRFSFVDKRRRNTNVSDLLIVQAFRDHSASAAQIARRFSVSDTHAITTFARYVDMPRRQFPEILCIDEVHLNISKQCKYALVLQDFITGEPVDLVISRREEYTLPYFAQIPGRERARVRYLICDMYRPYLNYVDKYFPNAVPVIDAFHVIQLINRYFLQYIRSVQRRLDARDRLRHEEREQQFHRQLPFTHSKDYLVLKKYHWLLLKNRDDIKYYSQPRMDYQLGRLMNTYDYEQWLYRIDPNFEDIRELKEKYVTFNRKYAGDPKGARKALSGIISLYRNSKYNIFRDISYTLEEFFDPIIQSFIMIQRIGKKGSYASRLSNGPIEALNRIPKDMKRIGRGYRNFYYLRNRFLFSQRKNAAILATPKTLDEVLVKRLRPMK